MLPMLFTGTSEGTPFSDESRITPKRIAQVPIVVMGLQVMYLARSTGAYVTRSP
jgi:hypothetical protein